MSVKRKVLICTPCSNGYVAASYAASIWAVSRAQDVALSDVYCWAGDLVRVRSRAVRVFLESDFTDLLFWDSDVAARVEVIIGLLAASKDIVAAPYPYKKLHWDRVGNMATQTADHERLEAAAYDYPFHLAADVPHCDASGCCKVEAVPMGLTLISRACAKMMAEHYAPALTFVDSGNKPTVGLFQLMIRNGMLLSEDYSFCRRWTDLGGEVHVYTGAGTPVMHVGTYEYRGAREGLFTR